VARGRLSLLILRQDGKANPELHHGEDGSNCRDLVVSDCAASIVMPLSVGI